MTTATLAMSTTHGNADDLAKAGVVGVTIVWADNSEVADVIGSHRWLY